MGTYIQYALACLGILLLDMCIRHYALRKWLGIALFFVGAAALFLLPPFIDGIDVPIFAIAATGVGLKIFSTRRKHEQ